MKEIDISEKKKPKETIVYQAASPFKNEVEEESSLEFGHLKGWAGDESNDHQVHISKEMRSLLTDPSMAGAKQIIANKDRVRETKLGIFKQAKREGSALEVFNRLN